MEIVVWGAGKYLHYVLEAIREDVNVAAIVDMDTLKQGKFFNNIKIISPDELRCYKFEIIIISCVKSKSIQEYIEINKFGNKRIIKFWESDEEADVLKNKNQILLDNIRKLDIYRARLDSAPFEWGLRKIPNILSAKLLLEKIIEDGCSLCRFGDGEYNIMLNQCGPWFQEYDYNLSKRLIEVINEKKDNILIGIAQNFKEFENYTEVAADEIRLYMEGEKRQQIMGLLPDRVFYNAYVSRPYLIYKNKKNADEIFKLMKEVWNGRNILLVEGQYSRLGVGNDLFSTAKDVKRIICPSSNAWFVYDAILSKVIEYSKNHECLVCISLGPTATILAYDLAVLGVQALDIGQVDNEYEWWKAHVSERVHIKGKIVAELSNAHIDDKCIPESYYAQIVDYIF